MTSNFWELIDPQLNELANEWINQYKPAYLIRTLNNKYYWWDLKPYRDAKLEYENAELSFLQWLNVAEALLGRPSDDKFEEALKLKIKKSLRDVLRSKMGDLLQHEK